MSSSARRPAVPAGAGASRHPAPLDHLDQNRDDRHHEKKVDEPTHRVRRHEPKQPENHQHDGHGHEHDLPRSQFDPATEPGCRPAPEARSGRGARRASRASPLREESTRSASGPRRYERDSGKAGTTRFERLRTTAINSLGSAGFDRYIWKPAPRIETRSSILA